MMMISAEAHMWVTLAMIVTGIAFYMVEKIPLELTSIVIISAFLLFFQFFPLNDANGHSLLTTKDILAGFADPALIAILALLVIGQAIIHTGALDEATRLLAHHGARHPRKTIFFSFLTVMAISALLNNTPVVVVFIPIMSALAERLRRSTSLLMMPLSYVAILGGMITLTGSSTNLLAAGSLEALTGIRLGFFEFSIPGLVLAISGGIYLMIMAPRLLPNHTSPKESLVPAGKQFIVQITVAAHSPLIGTQSVAGMFPDLEGMTIQLIQRGEHRFLPPFENMSLQADDQIIVATTRKSLTNIVAKYEGFLENILAQIPRHSRHKRNDEEAKNFTLAEIMVAPASIMAGRTLEQIGFHYQSGCFVMGIQRRSRMIRGAATEILLEAGDVLLIIGRRDDILRLRNSRDAVLLEWSASALSIDSHPHRCLWIFFAVIALAAGQILPIAIAATAGAAMMIAARCLDVREAARALDRRVMLLVGASLAMGMALERSGGATYLAHELIHLLSGAGTPIILSGFFLLVAAFSNVLSHTAAAILFTPIAVRLAGELGVDPRIFAIAVIMAANCSFATPMSYQTNLLVMGPGHYRFADFMRLGIPLTLFLWIVFSFFAPYYYGLH